MMKFGPSNDCVKGSIILALKIVQQFSVLEISWSSLLRKQVNSPVNLGREKKPVTNTFLCPNNDMLLNNIEFFLYICLFWHHEVIKTV